MRLTTRRFLNLAAVVSTAAALAACSSSSGNGGGSGGGGDNAPIVLGASLSLTGGFSTDGQAFKRGYQLWASTVNSHGGLLGRNVKLHILNDASSPTTAAANYTKLIVAGTQQSFCGRRAHEREV